VDGDRADVPPPHAPREALELREGTVAKSSHRRGKRVDKMFLRI